MRIKWNLCVCMYIYIFRYSSQGKGVAAVQIILTWSLTVQLSILQLFPSHKKTLKWHHKENMQISCKAFFTVD